MGRWTAAVLVAWLATACGRAPTAPAAGGTLRISELRIIGLPSSLSPGSTSQLIAEAVLPTGTVQGCAAAWSVDDARVASISSSGLLTGGTTGYVSVAASCGGLTARAETKVEAERRYHVVIVPYDREMYEPPAMKPLAATLEFLDGARAGQKMPAASFYRDGMPHVTWPVKVRLTADGYEPKDFVLSDATGERPNQTSLWFDFWVPMTFVQDALTDTVVRELSPTEKVSVHPFTMRTAGPVQVRTWWWGAYDADLSVRLTCGGSPLILRSGYWIGGPRGGTRGDGFTANIPGGAVCEVTVRQSIGYPRYRIAIRYAR